MKKRDICSLYIYHSTFIIYRLKVQQKFSLLTDINCNPVKGNRQAKSYRTLFLILCNDLQENKTCLFYRSIMPKPARSRGVDTKQKDTLTSCGFQHLLKQPFYRNLQIIFRNLLFIDRKIQIDYRKVLVGFRKLSTIKPILNLKP